MKQYDTYKDSGIEWIGAIPSHWEVKPIKYISKNLDGKRIPLNSSERAERRGDFPYYGATGIVDYINDFIFDGEFVLIGEDGAPFFINGREVSFVVKGKFWVNNHAHILKANELISPVLLSHYLNCVDYRSYISGSTRDKLTQDQLNTIKVSLPIPEEQTAIVNYLDRKTAEIDALIVDKKRLLELYEEEKTTIINQAVTKGIDTNAKMKDSGIEWLGEIPEHWEAVSLKWVSKIYSGGTPSKNNEDFWQNGTIPWLNSGTVNQFYITEPSEFITEDALNNSSAKWIPENSLVIALAGQGKTKGMAAQVMFKSTCNQSMGVIVPNNDLIENRFLLYYLVKNYQNIRNLGGGDKRDGINLEMVGGIPIPLLPIKEQHSIVRHIENEYRLIDAKIAKTQKLIVLLTEYRTALISEVVTGKIKVMD